MTHFRTTFILYLLIGWIQSAYGSYIPHVQKLQTLGQGYDINNQAFREKCVTGDIVFGGAQSGEVNFEKSLDQETLRTELDTMLHGKANMFIASAKASVKFHRATSMDKFSLNMVYRSYQRGKTAFLVNQRLTPLGQQAADSGDLTFMKLRCGHEYVEQVDLGGSLYIMVRLDFDNEAAREDYEAKITFKVMGYSKSKTVKGGSKFESSSARISFDAVQVGGDPSKLEKLLKEIKQKSCALDHLEDCHEAADRLLNYAIGAQGFEAQLNNMVYSETDYYPAQGYKTKSYEEGALPGIGEADYEPFSGQVEGILESRGTDFAQMAEVSEKAENLLTSRRLLPSEKIAITKIRDDASENIVQILRIRDTCLKLKKIKCVTDHQNLTLRSIDRNALIIPERLLDRCALADRSDSFDSDGIILIDIFQRYGFTSCENLLARASEVKQITVANKNLSSLEMLKFLPNVEYIDVRHNELVSLRFARFLPQLSYLNASHNQIQNITHLKYREGLKFVNLANNLITAISPLHTLHPRTLLFYGNPVNEDISDFVARKSEFDLMLSSNRDACEYELNQAITLNLIRSDLLEDYLELELTPAYVNPLSRAAGMRGAFVCHTLFSTFEYW